MEYWEVEGALAAFRETVLPNGCVEVMVNLGPAHRVLGPAGDRVWDRAWLCGLQEHALRVESDRGTHLVSARLHPLGAAALLGSRVPEAANAIVDLEHAFGPPARDLRGRLLAGPSPDDRFGVLEDFLAGRLRSSVAPPGFVAGAAARIDEAHGRLAVSRLHEDLGISRKHLAVSFARWLGMPAKAYARIRRFVWTLDQLRETSAPDWSRLASEAGYSDQSHLVRDFRRVGAASPTEYLRRVSPDGSSLLDER